MKNSFGSSVCVTLFGESHGPKIGAVLDGLAPGIPVDEDLIRKRLSVCEGCEKHVLGTCLACGCYVLIRASAKGSRCPRKKW